MILITGATGVVGERPQRSLHRRGVPMKRIAGVTSLVFAGLFAGFLTAVLVLELSLRRFDGTVYTQVRLAELDSLDKLAVATLLPALISTAVLAYRSFRTQARWPSVAAFVLLVFVFGLTLAVNLPINADQAHWTVQSPPPDWAGLRDRWQIAHAVRTAAAVISFVVLALAVPPRAQSSAVPPRARSQAEPSPARSR
ncbi:anthrone oxygenase family protein [Actinoplanes sp. NPDC051513]|uniref:anthrone oxygenase family protein n=1 Tax=Actinoplanes sp. NPDC051513 TaxID=3363908 RepID=UPI003795EC6B